MTYLINAEKERIHVPNHILKQIKIYTDFGYQFVEEYNNGSLKEYHLIYNNFWILLSYVDYKLVDIGFHFPYEHEQHNNPITFKTYKKANNYILNRFTYYK